MSCRGLHWRQRGGCPSFGPGASSAPRPKSQRRVLDGRSTAWPRGRCGATAQQAAAPRLRSWKPACSAHHRKHRIHRMVWAQVRGPAAGGPSSPLHGTVVVDAAHDDAAPTVWPGGRGCTTADPPSSSSRTSYRPDLMAVTGRRGPSFVSRTQSRSRSRNDGSSLRRAGVSTLHDDAAPARARWSWLHSRRMSPRPRDPRVARTSWP